MNRLRELRKRADMTQKELARETGLTVVTIWYIENNTKHQVRDSTKKKIADALCWDKTDIWPCCPTCGKRINEGL